MYLIYDGQTQSGPFDVGQLDTMLRNGTVSRDSYYWKEGMPTWRPLMEFRLIAPARPVPRMKKPQKIEEISPKRLYAVAAYQRSFWILGMWYVGYSTFLVAVLIVATLTNFHGSVTVPPTTPHEGIGSVALVADLIGLTAGAAFSVLSWLLLWSVLRVRIALYSWNSIAVLIILFGIPGAFLLEMPITHWQIRKLYRREGIPYNFWGFCDKDTVRNLKVN